MPKMIILCVIYSLAAIFFFMALDITDNSSELVSLNLLSGILTVLLSIVIFKEREKVVIKIIAGLVSLAGLLLIT
jgi:uncharacterized membrane protein